MDFDMHGQFDLDHSGREETNCAGRSAPFIDVHLSVTLVVLNFSTKACADRSGSPLPRDRDTRGCSYK
jgi:hypothetical protein